MENYIKEYTFKKCMNLKMLLIALFFIVYILVLGLTPSKENFEKSIGKKKPDYNLAVNFMAIIIVIIITCIVGGIIL